MGKVASIALYKQLYDLLKELFGFLATATLASEHIIYVINELKKISEYVRKHNGTSD